VKISDAGQLVGKGDLGVPVDAAGRDLPAGVDVAIDFSAPTATLALAKQLGQGKIPLVTGTTGFTDPERAQLSEHMTGVACVLAPNMSIGVNVLFKLAHDVTRILGESRLMPRAGRPFGWERKWPEPGRSPSRRRPPTEGKAGAVPGRRTR
jgi:dihydrodipicolinate reductase